MLLLEELRIVAKDKAARTLPLGTVMPENTLEGRAANKIDHLLKIIRAIDRINDNPAHYDAKINDLCESA